MVSRVLCTGGAGFIGGHLVDRLVSEGNEVTVVDDLSCKTTVVYRSAEARFERVDVKDAERIDRVLSEGYDAVFHLAASADIRRSLVDQRVDLDNNVIGTINVLSAMRKYHVRDFVFASSSAVYGEAAVVPTPETYMPIQTSMYGASKLAAEGFAEAFTEFADMRFWAFRFANVIGERCLRGVVGDFVRKLQKNPAELEVLGDGKQSKEYLYVKDCVEGIMVGYRRSFEKTNIFNLGVDRQTTVDEIADIVIDEMGLRDVTRRYTGGKRGWIGDIPLVSLCLDKIERLGWKQSVSSEEAIRRTVRWNVEYSRRRS